MDKVRIILVIPAYNEEANILKTYKKVQDYNKKNKTNYDVIVINVKVSDNYEKSGQKDMNIIMKIEDGTNYRMSFSIN